jgi:transcriptional regulator with XRE-family HTH domain
VAEPPDVFAGFLREVRTEARLTQEDLAEASGVRPRSISDLERGVAVTPQRETIRRLADALKLTGLVRVQFEAIARGRPVPAGTEADGVGGAAAATRTLPRDIASFTGRQQELQELVTATSTAAQSGGVVSIHAIGGMAGVSPARPASRTSRAAASPGGSVSRLTAVASSSADRRRRLVTSTRLPPTPGSSGST